MKIMNVMAKHRYRFWKIRQIAKSIAFILLFVSVMAFDGISQDNVSLPQEYFSLKSDKDKMLFLMKAISDSLDEDQLTHILDWSGWGLQMAKKNNIDTLKGIFLFDIAKAYTYKFLKYDSAIFYYKQVIPYFPDKMRKYNVYSVREIMERYADLGNKDSSFVYLNKLEALIDTMPDLASKKISLSQNIATVYQYFGMYKTAIRYFQVAINGDRKSVV